MCRKEHELIALRRSLEDAERTAAEEQHALQQELETANQVGRILERENQRLTAEIETLRRQIEAQRDQQDATLRIQELELENQRLLAEIDELRRQTSPSSSAVETDDTLLETLLTRELNASPAEPPRIVFQARRFCKCTSAS
ncbi:MAG: hypothetical protein RMJ55_03025 [Roseiflexaceae bacterium]|nr:hypothetical protein [Roseiflexaceae bacterium]